MPNYYQRFVLLVEDEEIVRVVFERVVARHPEFLLDSTPSVPEACAKVRTFAYDAIFLDMNFTVPDEGLEVLRELAGLREEFKHQAFHPTHLTRVLVLSGTVLPASVMPEAQRLGAIWYMAKPAPFTEAFVELALEQVRLAMLPKVIGEMTV